MRYAIAILAIFISTGIQAQSQLAIVNRSACPINVLPYFYDGTTCYQNTVFLVVQPGTVHVEFVGATDQFHSAEVWYNASLPSSVGSLSGCTPCTNPAPIAPIAGCSGGTALWTEWGLCAGSLLEIQP